MLLIYILVSFLCFTILCGSRILIYDTKNVTISSEQFHCVYVLDNVHHEHGGSSGDKIPFCRKPNITGNLIAKDSECENEGVKEYFIDLLENNTRPFEVLKWNSGVDVADDYAAFYYNKHLINQSFICRCTNPNTFGRYCEYKLTHKASSFEASHSLQVNTRISMEMYYQQFGSILCYITLICNSGLLCLDWRDICDGEQQCENGWDEENCDKLEFNECEENEYRCQNGMCIPEEYWLDGDKDCMDWSDENFHDFTGRWCFLTTSTIDCNEHICINNMWSCGDGQCIDWYERLAFQAFLPIHSNCLNLRNLNYMCELNPSRRAWTMSNGLCWVFNDGIDDPKLSMNNITLSNQEKCIYLIRCALSDGFEYDCPCNRFNCSHIMSNVCIRGNDYPYPLRPLIRPYLSTFYDWTSDFKNKMPKMFVLSGVIRCRGYQGYIEQSPTLRLPLSLQLVTNFRLDAYICAYDDILRDANSSIKYDDKCWNNSLTFNGRPYAVRDVCKGALECISQYRINDGWANCLYTGDEKILINNEDLCSRVRRHRFQCSIGEPTCLPAFMLGKAESQCSNYYDVYLYGYNDSIAEMPCRRTHPDHCQRLIEYIKNSTIMISNSSTNINNSYVNQLQYRSTNRISFRSYCDSNWRLPGHIDELPEYCREWICHRDQYQCQTGQCIPLNWVCDKQWDCSDASDEEAMLSIRQWSSHNEQLTGLNEKREKCLQDYAKLPFSEFCNTKEEFPCLRSNVSDVLDFNASRPCILYSKIGDQIEDCYNAYDEKNTFEINDGTMWGLAFQCNNESLKYRLACEPSLIECAQLFCPYRQYQLTNYSKPNDVVCIDGSYVPEGRCNDVPNCDYGEDEYWCAPKNYLEQHLYRYLKMKLKDNHNIFDKQIYPSLEGTAQTFNRLPQTKVLSGADLYHAFLCNQGIAINIINYITCFCSPAYFGGTCEFFSDRITIITHLDLTTWPSLLKTYPKLFTIKVSFLFNKTTIIDHYEFHSNPIVEKHHYIKHKFYLLYSRSPQMLLHKRTRFYNRTDIENNHPYSVHFDIYALQNNYTTPVVLGSWHYPIYFDFLPSFRLATVLRFPRWFGNSSFDPCANHTCNKNSTCKPIFNQNNSYICTCRNGFYGINCSEYEDTCTSYCSPHSLCQPDAHRDPICICPFEHFGPRCFLKFEQCDHNPCWNNGSCIYNYESYGGDSFECICSKLFYGDRCQYIKMALQVRLNITDTIESPRVSSIQFYDVDNNTFQLILRHQQIVEGFPSLISYDHDLIIAPVLGVLKTHYDSIPSKYFIVYLQPNMLTINISSSPEYCPLASSLLNQSKYSISDVFKYHHICRNNSQRLCFYDNDYFCICQSDHYRVDCFLHNTQIDHCTKCLANGKCVKGDIDDDNAFFCICPQCHRGRLCEFNIRAFGFTLDSLLVDCSTGMKIFYLSIAFVLFFIGLFNNLCSFVTFKRPLPRKVGVGNYLFIITCLNQISLLVLLSKFIQITFQITNFNSCKIISYLLSVFTRLTYWLASWVTIDRLFVIFFPTSTFLKKPSLSIGISIITALSLFGMHIHEFIYYTTIQHLSTSSSICVTNFDTHLISTYNHVSTLIHYLLPFCIQIIAITFLIILAAQSRTKTTGGKKTFRNVLIKQFRTQKELYTTPIIIILSALPQTILTFILACSELTDWHRHTLLVTYLLSYAPQILGFFLYVLPSTSYKKEFQQTLIAKRYSRWMSDKKILNIHSQRDGAKTERKRHM